MNSITPSPLNRIYRLSENLVQLSPRRPVRPRHLHQNDSLYHEHEFHEICIVLNGSAINRGIDFSYHVKKGSVLALRQDHVHMFTDTKDFDIVNIYYLAEWFLADVCALRDIQCLVPLFFAFRRGNAGREKSIPHWKLNAAEFAACERDLQDLIAEDKKAEPSLLFLETTFLKLLVRLSWSFLRQKNPSDYLELDSNFIPVVERIEALVRKRTPLNTHQLAREHGFSQEYFGRLFKKNTGLSPTEYYQKNRVQHVCHYLLNSNCTISEAAYEFGYADAAHLNRCFRRFMKTTPKKYRQKLKAG